MKYFKTSEFDCNCCGFNNMNPHIYHHIDVLRAKCQFPFFVTSGSRCKAHNEKVGSRSTSQHLLGNAADIKRNFNGEGLALLVFNAYTLGLQVGIGPDFIHLDCRDRPNRIFTYY